VLDATGETIVYRTSVALLLLCLAMGCSSNHAAPAASTDTNLELREELRILKEELAQLKEKQEQSEFNQFLRDFEKIAYLQPGDEGYSTVRYDLGVLTAQLSNVEPYANGSRVTLKLGNPLYSAVSGVKAKVEWGRTDEKGSPDNESAKSKDITLSETLLPGAWTSTQIVLEGLPPTDLGFVRVKDVSHTGIKLNR
jgi:hypothetical protein